MEGLKTGIKTAKRNSFPNGGTTAVDSHLIRRILSGQKELYADLIRRYHKKVMGHCLSMLQNLTEAEEAVQDIFVKAYCSLEKFKGNSSFSTWLYRISTNHCLDQLRKRSRRKTYSLNTLMEEGDQIHRLFASTPVAVSQIENRDLVEKILFTLPEDCRTILTLREADGLEYQEIANVLNCSIYAVKGRLCRARHRLWAALQPFMVPHGEGIYHRDFLFERFEENNFFSRAVVSPVRYGDRPIAKPLVAQ